MEVPSPAGLGAGDVNFPRTRLLCDGCPPLGKCHLKGALGRLIPGSVPIIWKSLRESRGNDEKTSSTSSRDRRMAMNEIFHSKTAMPLCAASPVIEINHEREVRPERNTANYITDCIHSELDKELPTFTSSDSANGSEIIADSGSLNNDASRDQEASSELTRNSADEIAVSHFEADELAASFPAKETIHYQSCDACVQAAPTIEDEDPLTEAEEMDCPDSDHEDPTWNPKMENEQPKPSKFQEDIEEQYKHHKNDDVGGSHNSRLNVDGKDLREEPKEIVFLSKLLLLFQFCNKCLAPIPKVDVSQVGISRLRIRALIFFTYVTLPFLAKRH
ncbi:hypothetical protein AWC38_SpisGene22173 [Stylophora pistillata]|uniref:Uncharacterized protein n=1 Tax=Stylophora pistillata TaxID=50429 RepID=A0A2B4R5U0_STYPI|nr:hypothetical protein AWC38_SpisGene22173 [Stylophora pistillata]